MCEVDHKAVPGDQIVKGYEVAKATYVHVTDEDFAAAEVEGYRTVAIEEFVSYEEIDPIYFERTYYLGPRDGAERVYALLRRAMEGSGLAGIARYVMRNREHLGCLRVRKGVITLERMYFADEIRPIDEIDPRHGRGRQEGAETAADHRPLRGDVEARAVPGHVPSQAPRGDQGEAERRGGPRRADARARPSRGLARSASRERRGRKEAAAQGSRGSFAQLVQDA